MPFFARREDLAGIVLAAEHEGVGHARHRRVGEALAAAVAGRRDAHQPGVEPVLDIALEDAVLDQHVALRRRALVVDGQRAAPVADRAVVDHGDAGRRDPLADPAGEGRGALAVEIALEAVADRLVQQHAGPAGAEHDRHLAGRRGDRFEVHQRLGQRDVDRPVPGRRLEQIVVEIAAAEAVIAGLAPAVLLGDDLDVEPDQRPHVMGDEAVGADDVDHAPRCPASADRDLGDARIAGAGGGVDLLAERDLARERDQARADRRRCRAWRWSAAAAPGAAPLAGSSTAIVSAARRIAASLSSLAWAKAVVSPETPRRPKPAWVLKSAVFSRPSSKPKLSEAVYWR